jgi:4,5:9,10-diseco-3-hydroxy-5,9,17-trioxoandrosta-1(10),2-diene-4-oate hydrolase
MEQPRRTLVGARSPGHEVVVDGIRIAYDDEGEGPPLVCTHAIGHGARDFETLRARLRHRYRVVAPDWPGHGSSGDDREPASAARYAGVLEGLVDALGLGDLVLLGNSIGGAAAIHFAARRLRQTRALVLVDPGGLDRVDLLARGVTRAMAAFFAAGARGARWFPRAFELYYRMVLPGLPARAQRERIVAAARESSPRLAEAWGSFGEPSADLRVLATRLACPVLVAWARSDRVVQLRRSRPAIARIPDARLELFPGGHAPFLECPDDFVPALERFLDRVWTAAADAARAAATDRRAAGG